MMCDYLSALWSRVCLIVRYDSYYIKFTRILIFSDFTRLASVGILEKERELRVGKLGWHWSFDTGFERNIIIPCAGFLNFFEIASVLQV